MISRQQESKTFNPLVGPEMPARASYRSRDTLLQIHFRALVRDRAIVQSDSNRVGSMMVRISRDSFLGESASFETRREHSDKRSSFRSGVYLWLRKTGRRWVRCHPMSDSMFFSTDASEPLRVPEAEDPCQEECVWTPTDQAD